MDNIDIKILAYALSEKRFIIELQSTIKEGYFLPKYRVLYKIISKCFNRFREIPTFKVIKEHFEKFCTEDMENLYNEIEKQEVDNREFPSDLELLKKRYNEDLVANFGVKVFENNWNGSGFTDIEEVNKEVKKLSTTISSIYCKNIYKEGSLKESAEDSWTRYKQIKENPELAKGIHLGIRDFDRITNGLQKNELMLIGGESSAGKSLLAMNMGINAWLGNNSIPDDFNNINFNNSGKNVLFFSIEMPFVALKRRVDACLAGIPLYGVRDGTLNEQEELLYKKALKFQKLYHKNFKIIDIPRGCTVEQIESKYVEVCDNEFIPDLNIIDYLSLMESGFDGGDWLGLGKISERLHEFCRYYNTCAISPVQLTKPEKNHSKTVVKADQHRVGRSIMLPQNANILLNIETRPDEENKPDMVIRIAKMRDGEKGAFILHKAFHMMRVYDDVPGWEPEMYKQEVNDGYQGS